MLLLRFEKLNFLATRLRVSRGNFLTSKSERKVTMKKFLIFQEMRLFSSKLKKFIHFFQEKLSYISEGNLQILKNKNF